MHKNYKTFENVRAWQLARSFRRKISRVSEKFPEKEQYILTEQIRKNVILITTNLAESCSRDSLQENIQPCKTLQDLINKALDLLYIALDEKYITKKEFDKLYQKAKRLEDAIEKLKKDKKQKITNINSSPKSQVLSWQSEAYKNWGHIVDILAVKNNLKPLCLFLEKSKKKTEALKKICSEIGILFEYTSYRYREVKKGSLTKTNIEYNVYISKNSKLIRQAKKILSRAFILNIGYSHKDLGLLLGYPSCCVERPSPNRKEIIPSIKPYISNKIPFCNNNFLVSSGSNCYLGSHMPCSYSCQRTTQLNKNKLAMLKKETPSYYQFLKKFLKKPQLLWINNPQPGFGPLDTLKSIVFDGYLKNKTLKYKKIYPHFPSN